ncbi:hypothetical protein ACWCOW_18065 [Streptomyces sp. NPDC001939]|uniref:hypothetical protein n=1 Tax=Streptomyces TaxID=1883 RepID=UPI001D0AF4A7|nr:MULTISPECIES: hypothetical protein [Streptomyces]MCX5082279.1 hypothetical protein [Streptomyces sp. NBC_00401]UDM00462.1 hypothetical protein LGI35_20315 [Streptomyces longhuiensis]
MGMKDQFQDKAEQLAAQAKKRPGQSRDRRDEASERSSQTHDSLRERGSQSEDSERRRQEAQDRYDHDYEV